MPINIEKQKNLILALVILLGIVIAISQFLYIVNEGEQVIIIQMGHPVRVVTNPGLKTKLPFVQEVIKFEKRLLDYDSAPAEILTRDKKNLVVDNYCRWKIKDPLKFLETVGTEIRAQSRLDDIVYAELRAQLGLHDLTDLISTVRETMMKKVTEGSNQKANLYGIEIIDVRIKRADLPPENEKPVFGRMKAEREREAKKYRSEGEEEALKIRADTAKEKKIILAEAYKKAQEIRGEGEAKAMKIYAEAYSRDPEFYSFSRSMESYKKALPGRTTFVFSAESEFFQYLKGHYGKEKTK